MKRKLNLLLLRFFDLLLGLSFIIVGVMMIKSNYGIFAEEYPIEFSVFPFDSWLIPGIISIILFGVGNILAFIFSFIKQDKPHFLSLTMGIILLISIILQVVATGSWYLASSEFLVLCFIQIALSTETLWTV